jgi:hypothetical protein
MPVRANPPGRDGRLRRIGTELYLGVLVVALVLVVGAGLVVAISSITSYVNWVAVND